MQGLHSVHIFQACPLLWGKPAPQDIGEEAVRERHGFTGQVLQPRAIGSPFTSKTAPHILITINSGLHTWSS